MVKTDVSSESPAYPYEEGTSMRNMADTAVLEAAREDDERRSGVTVPYEHTPGFLQDMEEERARDEHQSIIHEQRVKMGQVSPGFEDALLDELPSVVISNKAYEYTEDQRANNDLRDRDVIKLEFYEKVYLGLRAYLDSREKKESEYVLAGLNEYLDGVDLQKKG